MNSNTLDTLREELTKEMATTGYSGRQIAHHNRDEIIRRLASDGHSPEEMARFLQVDRDQVADRLEQLEL